MAAVLNHCLVVSPVRRRSAATGFSFMPDGLKDNAWQKSVPDLPYFKQRALSSPALVTAKVARLGALRQVNKPNHDPSVLRCRYVSVTAQDAIVDARAVGSHRPLHRAAQSFEIGLCFRDLHETPGAFS